MKNPPSRPRPRFPFYKDERVFGGHIKANRAAQVFIVTIMIAAGVFAWAVLFAIGEVDKVNSAVKTVREAQKSGHASRLHDQAVQQNELRSLACAQADIIEGLIAPQDPNYQRAKLYVAYLRKTYDCADLNYISPGVTSRPPTVPTTPRSTRTPGATPTQLPTPTVVPGTGVQPSPTSTRPSPSTSTKRVAAPAPAPVTRTKTVTPKPAPSAPAPSPVVSLGNLCVITGICI